MSDFKKIIEFLRLKRRSDESEIKQVAPNNIFFKRYSKQY